MVVHSVLQIWVWHCFKVIHIKLNWFSIHNNTSFLEEWLEVFVVFFNRPQFSRLSKTICPKFISMEILNVFWQRTSWFCSRGSNSPWCLKCFVQGIHWCALKNYFVTPLLGSLWSKKGKFGHFETKKIKWRTEL